MANKPDRSKETQLSVHVPRSDGLHAGFATPAKIGICYLLFLILPTLVITRFVGVKTVVKYAYANRDFSVLFSEYAYRNLSDDRREGNIICFGDSNSFYPFDIFAEAYTADLHMPAMIAEGVNRRSPQRRVKTSEWAFVGASMFDYYCMYFRAVKSSPDVIIVPINWTYFWLAHSRRFYEPELSAFVPIQERWLSGSNDPLAAKGISMTKQWGYKATLLYPYPSGLKAWLVENLGISSSLVEKEAEADTQLANNRGSHPSIADSNATFSSFRALVRVASNNDTKLLFYTLPLYKKCLEEKGAMDEDSVGLFKSLIAKECEKPNIYFLDLTDILDENSFVDLGGHFTLEGRKKVADALALEILEMQNTDQMN